MKRIKSNRTGTRARWWTSCFTLAAAALCTVVPTVSPAQDYGLPSIGSPADALLPRTEEARIGRSLMRMFYQRGLVVEDPELTEYINAIGHELVGHANNGDYEFQFFIVRDPSINAFALPGGFIGVHTGLIEATSSESELAGVLAHEIAHVTQRHIARTLQDNSRASMVTLAALLGAIIIGAATGAGGEVMESAVATSQAVQIQNQINFTRGYEYEADRIGISTLADAGFEIGAMADFFATMGRRTNNSLYPQLEFLRTHPVTSSRIAEARSREAKYDKQTHEDSLGYRLVKARIVALFRDTPEDAAAYFANRDGREEGDAEVYGRALAALRANDAALAERLFEELIANQEKVIAYHVGLAQAQAANDQARKARETFANAQALFPRNVPLTIRHAEMLIDQGHASKAHALLLDLLNQVPPTPEQVRLIARAAIAAGEVPEAHYYMAEYNIMTGDLIRAIVLLKRGADMPEATPIQRARFLSRVNFISEFLSEEQQRELRRESRSGLAMAGTR